MTHLKVIIRVRPSSQREIESGAIPVIEIQNKNTIAITNIKVPESNTGDSRQRVRRFTFDCCFAEDATQDDIYTKVEHVVSKAIKRRYHSCVLAYGQSSTGKTHTMMGFPHDPGLTPRLSRKIFDYLQETAVGDEFEHMKTTVSYLEIYNEKVQDLLVSGNVKNSSTLRVREHPKKGPYVQGLTEHQVKNPQDLLNWIRLGNDNRRVASTLSNPHSSRSHSVVTINCDGVRLYLVDLAGSERAGSKFYTNSRFREGANINRSLVALGNVISALAEPTKNRLNRRRFVPYRDSVLTWLLKDTLGGNSNTVMIATISPSSNCYSETVNTLRFGQRAKLIVSCPVVNEDPNEKIIRELRTEVDKLRKLLKEAQGSCFGFMLEQNLGEPHDRTSNIPSSSIPDEFVESKLSPLRISTETLIPLMNVQTSVNVEKKQLPKFRRTASVDFVGIMDRSRNSSFGSHESLPITKTKIGTKTVPKTTTTKPLTTSRISASTSNLRRRSVDKPTTLKTLLQRRSIPATPKTLEKSSETESKLDIKSKVDSLRKTSNPRHDIVANVTRRLYLKAKNKDAGTDMDGFDEVKDEIPKELSICSNARLRLKEITQKALRAHRFKQVETQTDCFVLRVKEISTDVQDLKMYIPEVRNVETSTPTVETKDVQTCMRLENFENSNTNDFMKITKSMAVQTDDEILEKKREVSPSRVSFTQYLQKYIPPLQPSIECMSSSSLSSPIYANNVNINVSHHYLNGKKIGSLSDDSLEDQSANQMLFPTPDLISNHNSLDPNIHASEQVKNDVTTFYALENFEFNDFQNCNEFQTATLQTSSAKIYTFADLDGVSSTTLPICTYLPEVCIINENFQKCSTLPPLELDYEKAVIIDFKSEICYEPLTIHQPTVLKSCVKTLPLENENFQNISDSLEYHKANSKHVRFSPEKKRNQDQLFKAMANFLEEATTLMNNITKAAKNFENSNEQDFDIQVTINDVENIIQTKNQTPKVYTETVSTQYEDFSIPTNKYDQLLGESCKKLEHTLNVVNKKTFTSEYSSLTSCQASFSGLSDANEDLSLESNPLSYSDYGSLNRMRRKPGCSPSAFLKQLARMRKKVVESSREDFADTNS